MCFSLIFTHSWLLRGGLSTVRVFTLIMRREAAWCHIGFRHLLWRRIKRPMQRWSNTHLIRNARCQTALRPVTECQNVHWRLTVCSFQSPFCSLWMISKSLCLYCIRSLLFCRSQDGNTEGDAGRSAPDNPVICEAEDSFMCAVALDDPTSFITAVTVSVSDSVAPPVLLKIPARPGEHSFFCLIF